LSVSPSSIKFIKGLIMKHLLIALLLLSAGMLFAQETDLSIQTNMTPEYMEYLYAQLDSCDQTIMFPPSDTALMKAYAKRVFLNMSLMHCTVETTLTINNEIIDTLKSTTRQMENFYATNIGNLNTENSKVFFAELLELFKDPRYDSLKMELERMAMNYEFGVFMLAMETSSSIFYLTDRLSQIKDDLSALSTNTIPFTVRVEFNDKGTITYLDFNEGHFKQADAIIQLADQSLSSFGQAMEQLVWFELGSTPPDDMINSFKNSTTYFLAGLDSLSILFQSAPLNLLPIDTTWIPDAREVVTEINSMLNGNTYVVGTDGVMIRPVAFLEHPIPSWPDIVFDFYRASDRYSYTFGNLFPYALPPVVVDKLKEDLVLNASDTEEQAHARMMEMNTQYLDSIATGHGNSSEYFGAALTGTYLYLADMKEEIAAFAQYLHAADFRTAFPFVVLNDAARVDSITTYFNIAHTDPDFLFTTLMVMDYQVQPYAIDTTTRFFPLFITPPMADNINGLAHDVVYTARDIQEYFKRLYDDLGNMFNLSLDPNYLDFSQTHSPYDVIMVLEQSNPNFLEITPYGVEKMQEMGENFKAGFGKMAGTMDDMNNFFDSLAVYRPEYNINEKEARWMFWAMNSFVQSANTDFQNPDSTMMMDSVRVNLSAWFDNPPHHLLEKFKFFFDNDSLTDNTLGGLFPDGLYLNEVPADQGIPQGYMLAQNYPNPFNPVTTITFQLPERSFVTLEVIDMLGKHVATLIQDVEPAGYKSVTFDASGLASGSYYYRLKAGTYIETKKLVLVK